VEAAIVVTYRCVNHCVRCHTWKFPTDPAAEFEPALLEKLPHLSFCNVTGGEPFLRGDLREVVATLSRKADRVVVSTNGFFTDRVVRLAEEFPRVGIRVSLEGLPAVSDELRGMRDSFDHGLRTLLELTRIKHRDIGFSTTISDRNADDVLHLYRLAKGMGWEFATAAVHNSSYFHKTDNRIENPDLVIVRVEELISELLSSPRVKDWFRAYFNHGIVRYLKGRPRLLPCAAGTGVFFLDPSGEVYPCNGMEPAVWHESMGNLHGQEFDALWNSERAVRIRSMVRSCPKNCWMIGTVSPVLRESPWRAARWVAGAQLKRALGRHP
jgi:radical SAM protein with 4Fe4S-binding SPASM domain